MTQEVAADEITLKNAKGDQVAKIRLTDGLEIVLLDSRGLDAAKLHLTPNTIEWALYEFGRWVPKRLRTE